MQAPRNQAGLGGVGPARDAHAPKIKIVKEVIIDNSEASPKNGYVITITRGGE